MEQIGSCDKRERAAISPASFTAMASLWQWTFMVLFKLQRTGSIGPCGNKAEVAFTVSPMATASTSLRALALCRLPTERTGLAATRKPRMDFASRLATACSWRQAVAARFSPQQTEPTGLCDNRGHQRDLTASHTAKANLWPSEISARFSRPLIER